MSDVYYPRFPGDYQRDTSHLSLVEHGAYGQLLDFYYSGEKPLPSDRQTLYRICRAFSKLEREAVDSVAGQFFRQAERADEEIEKRHKYLKERSDAGRQGAERRWHKESKPAVLEIPNAMPKL
jgi:uncharacterized protein YdaU (DUF1376 family)